MFWEQLGVIRFDTTPVVVVISGLSTTFDVFCRVGAFFQLSAPLLGAINFHVRLTISYYSKTDHCWRRLFSREKLKEEGDPDTVIRVFLELTMSSASEETMRATADYTESDNSES